MNDSPSISVPKFSLRPLKEKDAPRMLEWMNDPDSTQFLRIGGKKYTIKDTLAFIEKAKDESNNLHRAIVNDKNEYLGTISLKNINHDKGDAEYAIAIHPEARSTGAAFWASKEIFKTAKNELGLRLIYLNVQKNNIRANRFYKKLESLGLKYTKESLIEINGCSVILLWYEINLTQSHLD